MKAVYCLQKKNRRKKLDRRNRRNNLEQKAIEEIEQKAIEEKRKEKKIDKLDYIKIKDISAPKNRTDKEKAAYRMR